MKKLIGLMVLGVILLSAGIYEDNDRYLGQINAAVANHVACSNAYFNDVTVNGQLITLTQEQKDALKAAANVELEKIKTYADSLNIYP